MDIITAKILRKKVDDRTYNGATKISFMVTSRGTEKWLSAFVDEKKMPPDVVSLFRELGEGDKAEFQYEAKESGGKTFYNIKSLTRVTDIHDEVPAKPEDGEEIARARGAYTPSAPVQPDRHSDFPYSMKVSYCKDLMIGFPELEINDLLRRVDALKQMADRMGE